MNLEFFVYSLFCLTRTKAPYTTRLLRSLTEFSFFFGLKPAITNFFSCDNITNVVDDNNEPIVKLSILPTDFRTNWIYIRVYILWMNMIVMILIPFVLLLYLNLQVRML